MVLAVAKDAVAVLGGAFQEGRRASVSGESHQWEAAVPRSSSQPMA